MEEMYEDEEEELIELENAAKTGERRLTFFDEYKLIKIENEKLKAKNAELQKSLEAYTALGTPEQIRKTLESLVDF